MLTLVMMSSERVFTHSAAPVARPCPVSDRDVMDKQKKADGFVASSSKDSQSILASHGKKLRKYRDIFSSSSCSLVMV